MNLKKVCIKAGASQAFKLLHITDSHLALACERDDVRKRQLSQSRRSEFETEPGQCERYLDEAILYAKENNIRLVHTGDLIDFVSYKNLEVVKERFSSLYYILTAGNHEFSLYVGEAFEDEAYKAVSFYLVQSVFRNNISFYAALVNGVNLIFIDNSYYQFNKTQNHLLSVELKKNIPAVLFMHNPLYVHDLYVEKMRTNPCAYLVACPEELIVGYDEYRYRQQKADYITLDTVSLIKNSKNIKAIFTGHLHTTHETILDCGITQYVTGGAYQGNACEISII